MLTGRIYAVNSHPLRFVVRKQRHQAPLRDQRPGAVQRLQGDARPEIQVDQQAQPDLTRDLILMQVEEDIDGMKRLNMTLVGIGPREGDSNEQLNWLDGSVLDFGKALSITRASSAHAGSSS